MLNELLEAVLKNKTPCIIALVGEPGVGRSALMDRFRRRHDNEFSDLSAVRGYVTGRGGRKDTFAPFGRLLFNLLGLDEGWTPEAQRDHVRNRVAALEPANLPERLAALDTFLGLGLVSPAEAAGPSDPELARRRAFGAFTWLLQRVAHRRPLLALVEGLGEATPEGLALLNHLHEHLTETPLMMLCELERLAFVGNPTYFQRFGDGVLQIRPLAREATGRLMRKLAERSDRPPDNLLDLVHEAARGLPGRVAEVTERLVSYGAVPTAPGAGWGVEPDVPITLDFPLTAEEAARHRLDQHSETERRWLIRAAVVGGVFWRDALIPLARMEQGASESVTGWIELPEPARLDEVLAGLERSGVLARDESANPEMPRYRFTDEAERAWLESRLDARERRRMHLVVAEWLEGRLDPADQAQLAEIARHYQRGDNPARAAFYFIQTAERARARFAIDEAVEAFEQAVALLDEKNALALMDVYHALGALHTTAGRHQQAEVYFRKMLFHAWVLDHRSKAGAALNRLGRLARARARYDKAAGFIEQGRALFEAADDAAGVAASLDDLGQVTLRRGDRENALALFTEALSLRRQLGDSRSVGVSLANLARVQRDTGFLQMAEATFKEALALQQQIADVTGVVNTCLALSELYLRRQDFSHSQRYAREALNRASETGHRGLTAKAMALLASVGTRTSDHGEALDWGRQACALAEQLGDVRVQTRARRSIVLALAAAGRRAEARRAIDAAVDLARRHEEHLELGLCLKVSGDLHLAESGLDLEQATAEARVLTPSPELDRSVDDASISRLIDEVLAEDEADLPPSVAALNVEGRAHLEDAMEAYNEAVGVLGEVAETRAQAETLRAQARAVAASGDLPRATTLADRAAALEDDLRRRASQTA